GRSGDLGRLPPSPSDMAAGVSLAFGADGRTLRAVGTDLTVWRWNLDEPTAPPVSETSGATPTEFRPGVSISAAALSPDGKTLAVGSSHGAVWLWRLDNRDHPPVGLPAVAPAHISAVA